MYNIKHIKYVLHSAEQGFFLLSLLFCFTYAVVEFFLMVDLWPCHNQFRSCFEPGLNFFFAAQCETRFVKEGLFVVDEAKFKSAMTKQMLPHSVAAWVHIGLKITEFVQFVCLKGRNNLCLTNPIRICRVLQVNNDTQILFSNVLYFETTNLEVSLIFIY